MQFSLIVGSMAKLDNLRAKYLEIRNVDLTQEPGIFSLPTMFGGTDVTSRNGQITFLEKLKFILDEDLKEGPDLTDEQVQANFTASKIMLAGCLYVQSQIKSPKRDSALYRVINECLEIKGNNYFDDTDKKVCYFTAQRCLNSAKLNFDEANTRLKKAGKSKFTEAEWNQFSKFLNAQCVEEINSTQFPVAAISKEIIGKPFAWAGYTGGALFGEMLSHQYNLTAFVGGTLLVLGPASSTGMALFVPILAGRIATIYCSISLAHILGMVMELLGKCVGFAMGMPFDLSYKLLCNSITAINHYRNKCDDSVQLLGTRIEDGVNTINLMPVTLTLTEDLPKGFDKHEVEIASDGAVTIDGVKTSTEDKNQLDPKVIEELTETLKLNKQESVEYEEQTEETGLGIN